MCIIMTYLNNSQIVSSFIGLRHQVNVDLAMKEFNKTKAKIKKRRSMLAKKNSDQPVMANPQDHIQYLLEDLIDETGVMAHTLQTAQVAEAFHTDELRGLTEE